MFYITASFSALGDFVESSFNCRSSRPNGIKESEQRVSSIWDTLHRKFFAEKSTPKIDSSRRSFQMTSKRIPFSEKPNVIKRLTNRYLEKAKTLDSIRYDIIMLYLNKVEQQLKVNSKCWKKFDSGSFGIVISYLANLYVVKKIYNKSDRLNIQDYGDVYHHFLHHQHNAQVFEFFTLCLENLPQNIINELAEKVSDSLMKDIFIPEAEGDLKKWGFLFEITSRATHSSQNMLFSSAYINDKKGLARCLSDTRINRFAFNVIGLTPLCIASMAVLKQVAEESANSCFTLRDIDHAYLLKQQRQKLETQTILRRIQQGFEFGKLPRLHRIDARTPTPEQVALFRSCLSKQAGRFSYHGFLAFEKTLVKFNNPRDYFHANYVMGGLGIASEAPNEDTTGTFWRMMWETHTNAIVMLTNFGTQCSDYHLPGKHGHLSVQQQVHPEVVITNDEQSLVKRMIILSNGKKSRVITHWQIENWPDASVIPPAFLANVVKIVAKEISDGTISRIEAHCMAGIGRTGTFYTTLRAYLAFLDGNRSPDLVHKTAVKLRDDRHGSIQTKEQYLLVNETFELLIAEAEIQLAPKEKTEKKG